MKKVLALIVATVFAIALAGCSSSGSASSASASSSAASASASASASDSASASASSGSLFASNEWPQNEATEGVPVPQFSGTMDGISTSDRMVGGHWVDVPESEVAAYVEQLKAAGFDKEVSENKAADRYSFSAKDAESSNSIAIILSYTKDGSVDLIVQNFKK